MYWWPRTIRWQMLLSLVFIEAVSIALFAFLLTDYLQSHLSGRVHARLERQSATLALEVRQSIQDDHRSLTQLAVKMQASYPSVARAIVTDPAGKVLFTSEGDPAAHPLTTEEMAQIGQVHSGAPRIFKFDTRRQEGI